MGQAALFEGRLWEARALFRGSIELAEQIGSSDLAIRAATTLANITALDNPSEAVDVQREIITTARRLGRRALEINTIGNVSEDARRTGEWDWILGELEGARQYELDDAGEIVLDQAIAMLRIMRGEVTDEAVDLARPAARDARGPATSRRESSTSWGSRRSHAASSGRPLTSGSRASR